MKKLDQISKNFEILKKVSKPKKFEPRKPPTNLSLKMNEMVDKSLVANEPLNDLIFQKEIS